MSSSTDWDRAKSAVVDNADALRAMTTHSDLYRWAVDRKLDSKTMWPKVKHKMRTELGIDYNALREAATTQRTAEVADAVTDETPVIELWTAGDVTAATYAVCDETGENSWYGEFGRYDRVVDGDDLSAEVCAADKAVFVAGKAREKAGLDTVALIVHSCHPDLDVVDLAATAARHRVAVSVDVDDENPAVALCQAPGSRTWREVDLAALLDLEDELDDTDDAAVAS